MSLRSSPSLPTRPAGPTGTTVRPAAVAGQFYPADAATLRDAVRGHLRAASAAGRAVPGGRAPALLIAPHAGHVYSGPIAAHAYARLAGAAGRVRRVVLLGPVHRVPVRGLAVPAVDAFETPLGRVPIDRSARDAVVALPQVVRDDRPHAPEHSLEVQLPFLQEVLGDGFDLLPLAVGDASAEDVAGVLDRVWDVEDERTLVVVSTDLSHYLPYDAARRADRRTADRIAACATDLTPDEACGAHALNGALAAARRRGLAPVLLDLRNSGDTAGDRRRVVGYAAFACDRRIAASAPARDGEASNAAAAPAPGAAARASSDGARDAALGAALLGRARNAIAESLGLGPAHPRDDEPPHPALACAGATFVTLLDAGGELRGCIGRLEATDLLEHDVRSNARAAAFDDPRFPPLARHEWAGLQVEVSLLEPSEPLPPAASRREALRHLRPHEDGVILEWRGRRATFLPQVWAQLPDGEAFLDALVRKAGLPAGFWEAGVSLRRYRVRKFTRPAAAVDAPHAGEAR